MIFSKYNENETNYFVLTFYVEELAWSREEINFEAFLSVFSPANEVGLYCIPSKYALNCIIKTTEEINNSLIDGYMQLLSGLTEKGKNIDTT